MSETTADSSSPLLKVTLNASSPSPEGLHTEAVRLHDPMSTAEFKHTPLQATQIRLLLFTGNWLGIDSHIRPEVVVCLQCKNFDRATAPPYTALSYEWEDASCTHTIIMNGRPIKVRTNLWNALTHLPTHMAGYFRIDALCIDQANTVERNHQVKVMGQIYSQAELVIAWLGLYNESFRTCLSPMRDDSLDDIVQACLAMLASPYWTRLWIWQEIILAKATVMVCGSRSLPVEHFRRHVNYNLISWPDIAYIICTSMDEGANLSLWEALFNFGSCNCRESRDKIFAVLGVIRAVESVHLMTVFPDYALDSESIALIVLGHLRHFESGGQSLICRDAERVLCIFGAERCAELYQFRDTLRTFESTNRPLYERPTVGGRRRAGQRYTSSDVPPEARSAPEIREGLRRHVPGTTLSMLKVFDCLFGQREGFQVGDRRCTTIPTFKDLVPDFWATDRLPIDPNIMPQVRFAIHELHDIDGV